jgi:pheromone shutdown protein TraB
LPFAVQAVAEFGKQFPSLLAPLMHERDLFLASRLHHHASKMESGQQMVAVIGAGHVPGIQQNWGKDIDVEALLTIPPLNPMPLHFKLMVAVGVGGCIALAAAASGAVLVCGARAASWGMRLLPARGVLRR